MAATASRREPFQYTATGVLGDKRDTMLENQLLLRGELGRPMKRGYTEYPGISFRYGRPSGIKDGGAAQALGSWTENDLYFNRKLEGKDIKQQRDFMALNRAAVQAGLTTAQENYQFRATNVLHLKVKDEGERQKSTRRIPPDTVFGTATRPSTPIHDLLEHKYQDRWLMERRNAELAMRQKNDKQRGAPGKVCETRASQLRVYQVAVEGAPLWQMPKFNKKAKPQLETFRGDKAKQEAFKHHQSDCIARRGAVGQGVYEQAKN